jgi:raffinose/stachyose/melibiose transport system permease protein
MVQAVVKAKKLRYSFYGKISLFLLPALLIYSTFMAIPLLMSIKLSFYSTSGVGEATYVGFANFMKLFTDPYISERFNNALLNNFMFLVWTMLFQNALGLLIAGILSKKHRFFPIIRTVLFIPVTMSIVLVGYIWSLLLSPNWGAVNTTLVAIGLDSWAIPWLGNEHTALLSVALVNAWSSIGLAIMLFLAGLQGISDDLYEAADLDGAGRWAKFVHITIPQLSPVIGIVTILSVVGNFSQFELIYSLQGTNAGPNYATDVLGTFFYRTSFSSLTGAPPDLGLGAAISTVTFLIVCCLICFWLYYTQWRNAE